MCCIAGVKLTDTGLSEATTVTMQRVTDTAKAHNVVIATRIPVRPAEGKLLFSQRFDEATVGQASPGCERQQ